MEPNVGILDIAPYVGGAASLQDDKPVFRLVSNESALGISPKVLPAMHQVLHHVPYYPNGQYQGLRQAIAAVHGLNVDNIVCGNGSDELIHLLCQCYLKDGDEVIYSAHGFLMYPIAAKAASAKPVAVKEHHLTTNIDAIIEAITPRTKMVMLANPNNPTGTILTAHQLETLCRRLPSDVMLVLDGAYAEFVESPLYTAGERLVEHYHNVVMLRTFSKAFGLAGLRLGWGYFPPAIRDVLNRVRAPFNINTIAEAAGIACIQDIEHLQKVKAYNTKWRTFLTITLPTLGFNVVPSEANFILMETGDKTDLVYDWLVTNRIYVRKVKAYHLPTYLRVSIGQQDAVYALVEALKRYV
jgi:histidinol-phosphate aminotransferase